MLLDIVHFYYVYLYRNLCSNIKAVEGSGSEGAPKYVGEGVTYGVFMVVFCACARLPMHAHQVTDVRRREARTIAYIITT